MSDTDRIDDIVKLLRRAWQQAPDLRLGQLLVGLAEPHEPCPELFHLEDARLAKMLRRRVADGVTPLTAVRRDTILVGGPIDATRVTLAVYADDLEPDAITATLGVAPTSAHRKGDRKRATSPPARSGAWLLTVQDEAPRGPAELTEQLLDRLPDDAAIWHTLDQRCDLQLRYGIDMLAWNRGFHLPHPLTARIAAMRLSMGFDIYATLDDEAPL